MDAAHVVQRIGITLAHTLMSEARVPMNVSYESDQGVDMDYVLCSAFYIHMQDLKNLVSMKTDLWVAIVYKLDERGNQDIGFTITRHKIPACELNVYPMPSINYAAEVVKKFMAFSLLPYFELEGLAIKTNLNKLKGKYGDVDAWGDTITITVQAEDFPHDVDFRGGIFQGFSDRLLNSMKNDVSVAIKNKDKLRHRVFTDHNKIGIVFIPESTYLASRSVPKEL